MLDIEMKYNDIENDVEWFYAQALQNIVFSEGVVYEHIDDKENDDVNYVMVYLEQIRNEITDCIEKAKAYDIEKLKRSQGGRKSANNMTKAERVARATKASHARK